MALGADAAEADDRVQRVLISPGRATRLADGVDRSGRCRLLRIEQVERLEDRLGDDEELLSFLGLDGESPGARQLVQFVRLDPLDHRRYSLQNGMRAQPSSRGLSVWQSSTTSENFHPSGSSL